MFLINAYISMARRLNFAPKRRQAIIWAKAYQGTWRNMASIYNVCLMVVFCYSGNKGHIR